MLRWLLELSFCLVGCSPSTAGDDDANDSTHRDEEGQEGRLEKRETYMYNVDQNISTRINIYESTPTPTKLILSSIETRSH